VHANLLGLEEKNDDRHQKQFPPSARRIALPTEVALEVAMTVFSPPSQCHIGARLQKNRLICANGL
jgi:hypothetical protein